MGVGDRGSGSAYELRAPQDMGNTFPGPFGSGRMGNALESPPLPQKLGVRQTSGGFFKGDQRQAGGLCLGVDQSVEESGLGGG
jgi:hypothetical protein